MEAFHASLERQLSQNESSTRSVCAKISNNCSSDDCLAARGGNTNLRYFKRFVWERSETYKVVYIASRERQTCL